MRQVPENNGAGEGNRTLVFSLEGCCSTIELHPRATDQLSRHGSGLNRHARALETAFVPNVFRAERALNRR
jgi:hypothetical protein